MALTLPSGSKFGTPKEKNTIIDYFLFQYRTPAIYSAIWRNWENECFDEQLSWKIEKLARHELVTLSSNRCFVYLIVAQPTKSRSIHPMFP